MAGAGDVTHLLLAWSAGDVDARDELVPLVYRELRERASRALASERRDHTLQPTALVHETYKKLVDQRRVQWQSRAHFFGIAAQLMRRILVDHARRHGAQRRGGGAARMSLEDVTPEAPGGAEVEVIAVNEAMGRLAELDPDQARIVELRFFGGLTVEETAEVVGASRATVLRDWAMARAWLRRELDQPQD